MPLRASGRYVSPLISSAETPVPYSAAHGLILHANIFALQAKYAM
jgi:hypothetical protein